MKNRKRKFPSFIMFFVIIILIALATFKYVEYNLDSVSKNDDTNVLFVVDDGSTVTTILNKLELNNLIKNSDIAKIYLKLNPLAIKAGSYELNKSMDTIAILNYLSDSNNAIINDVTITFIEGDWFKDIVKKISDATDLTYQAIIDYTSDENVLNYLIEEYDILTPSILDSNVRYPLEGYLFPDTYTFYKDTSVEDAIAKLLNESNKLYLDNKELFEDSDLSIAEIITLASIVQYEASKEEDMKDIAQVFYNRMAINMPLQSSVTVCYALDLDKNNDSWQKCETNPDFDSAYNTYKYNGLPPGPILNPGKKAIMATLKPNKNDYYYFMADVYGDGTVYFSKTYQEHVNYVNKYLK